MAEEEVLGGDSVELMGVLEGRSEAGKEPGERP